MRHAMGLAAALLLGGAAQAKHGDPCAGPMPVSDVFAIRDVSVGAYEPNGVRVASVEGCVVTRDASMPSVDVFYVAFSNDHTPLHEDGQSGRRFMSTGYHGPHVPLRITRAGGEPKIGAVPLTDLRILAVVRWIDAAGADRWEGHFVPFRIVARSAQQP